MFVLLLFLLQRVASNKDERNDIIAIPIKSIMKTFFMEISYDSNHINNDQIPIYLQSNYSFIKRIPPDIKFHKTGEIEINTFDSNFICEQFQLNIYTINDIILPFSVLINKYINNNGDIKKKISFPLYYDNISHSIIHNINVKSHSFSFVNNTLFFGGIPNDITQNKKNVTCYPDALASGWSCPLNWITVEDQKFPINEDVYFETAESSFIVPRSFIMFLKEKALKKYIDTLQCDFFPIDNHIECKCDVINTMRDIEITISHFIFKISSDDIFDKYAEECYLRFITNRKDNKWYIGTVFINKFTPLFSYDTHSITFYYDSSIESESHSKISFLISNSVLLFIGIILNVFRYINYK